MILRQPLSTLFPYTTLFRSFRRIDRVEDDQPAVVDHAVGIFEAAGVAPPQRRADRVVSEVERRGLRQELPPRSEEHTSELQSLRHLVCRLLLEKKKNTTPQL